MASKRRKFSRFLILLLIGAMIALLVRSCTKDSGNIVSMDDLEVDHLSDSGFTVHQAVDLEISCIGSFQSDSSLAAYGWLMRQTDREVSWQLTPENAVRSRGALAEFTGTVRLEPGQYIAYFTAYGDPDRPKAGNNGFFERVSTLLDSDFQRWRTEEGKWRFDIKVVDRSTADAVNPYLTEDDQFFSSAFWNVNEAQQNSDAERAFSLSETSEIRVRALGEINGSAVDYAWIADLRTGNVVWQMSEENTVPAGGAVRNRLFNGIVKLPAGPYIAGYRSDLTHSPGFWRANPPMDPNGWGVALFPPENGSLEPFDPWKHLPKIAELTRLQDNDIQSFGVLLDRPLRVWVEAYGEGASQLFDYGWIIQKGENSPVWEMDLYHTEHAGGDKKNRRAEAVLELDPGKYGIFFRTDESHAYDAWNSDPPEHPERWGITVFSLDPEYVPAGRPLFADLETGEVSEAVLVSLRRFGNAKHSESPFVLDDSTRVSVVAVGEILLSDRYDYGWITRGDEIIWEMTRDNSVYAGGANKNRKVEATLTLPPGSYVAHFISDDSHAYGDFQDRPPDDPTSWGIEIRSLDAEAEEAEWDARNLK